MKWKNLNSVPGEGSYLCFMENCYVKMCYFTGTGSWLDMWSLTISGKVKYWANLPKLPKYETQK